MIQGMKYQCCRVFHDVLCNMKVLVDNTFFGVVLYVRLQVGSNYRKR